MFELKLQKDEGEEGTRGRSYGTNTDGWMDGRAGEIDGGNIVAGDGFRPAEYALP